MKILITGGTGFIGSRLALCCLKEGHDVLAVGRPGSAPAAEESNTAEIISAGGKVSAIF